MSAPRKYDEEFRDRAVRMYRDRLAELGETKLGVRRHLGGRGAATVVHDV